MIQINLVKGSKYKTLPDLSNDYFNHVSPLITGRSKVVREIYKCVVSGRIPDLVGVNKKSILFIMSIFCGRKISRKKDFGSEKEKVDFLKKNKVVCRAQFSNNTEKRDFVKLLDFISGTIPLRGYTLKELIISDPTTLESINNALKAEFHSIIGKNAIKKFLHYILDYSHIHRKSAISRLIFDNLNVNSCPYCNRNYISYIEHAGEKQIGPTLDHFFSKVDYPLLTASFFNLIPSCYVCNSNIKGKKEANLIENFHPFYHGYGKVAKFKLINTPRCYGAQLDIDYAADPVLAEKIRSSVDLQKGNAPLFKTNEIYKTGHHNDIKMILKKCDYVNSYYKCSLSQIRKLHGSVSEFYRLYFGKELHESDFNTYPLSKLNRDLVNERLPWLLI